MRLDPRSSSFTLFLGVLAALPPVATDMALPALADIGASLQARAGLAGLTLSLFMAGFALSPFFYGPLSDRYGRRPVLLVGLLLFAVSGVAATLAPNIGLLLAARLVQGMGAGVGMTLAMAMVRDLFHGREAQARLTLITIVINTAPMLAPAVGAEVAGWLGWRGIYAAIALWGLASLAAAWLWLGETATLPQGPQPPLLGAVLAGYRRVLGHGSIIAHVLLNACGFGWMFAYVAASPWLLIETLHVAPGLYAVLFACTGGGIVLGAMGGGRLVKAGVAPRKVLLAAVLLALASTLVLQALAASEHISVARCMPLLVLATAAFGMTAPTAAAGALAPLPELAGVAGGLLTSLQMLAGAAASALVAMLFPHLGVQAMSLTMAGFAIVGGLLVLWIWLGDTAKRAARQAA
ncbi:multidrug effflux MFS transporter [Pseudomonas sp. HR96]|uniref:multidrug effflux MFS transporter n=1 Tax=Pseudomonas sp. HR96 TaxID=1027966 RepID=UPI002A74C3ED|nr:multidrug effflux MFS transporter [Pseudomonas sp. HR96]WPO97654.1 multidrug effflux MFS transporter [Pseudomonas sp. HR96]